MKKGFFIIILIVICTSPFWLSALGGFATVDEPTTLKLLRATAESQALELGYADVSTNVGTDGNDYVAVVLAHKRGGVIERGVLRIPKTAWFWSGYKIQWW